ncbi:MAG: zinc ribbon domain-containing protein [Thermoplasmata archaeon]
MQLRVLFSIVNIGIFLVLFALEFVIPKYATILFYLLLAWFVASFLILRLPFMSRRIGGKPALPPAPTPAGAPLPSMGAPLTPGVDAAEIGFCPHCGTHVAPGTLVCPSCGRSTRIG